MCIARKRKALRELRIGDRVRDGGGHATDDGGHAPESDHLL
jgi:hypothetical protein